MSDPPSTPDATDVLDAGGGAGDRVISGGTLRIAFYALGSLLAVASTAFVSRHLGIAAFDGFATVLSLTAVALLVTDFGLAALGVREYVARTGEDRAHVMAVLVALRLLLMVLATVAMLVFALLSGFSSTLVAGTAVAGVGLIVQAVPATYSLPLAATLRLGWVGAIDFIRQAVQAVGLIVLVLLGAGTVPLLGSMVPAGLVSLAVAAWVARGLAPLWPRWDWREMTSLLRMAMSYAIGTSIGSIYAYVAQIVTHLSTTEHESGLFALSFRVFSVIVAVAIIAVGSAYPILTRAAGDDPERFGYAGTRLYEGIVLIGLLAAVGIGVGAPAIVEILGGPEFRDAVDVARLHAAAIPGSFAVAAGSFLLLATRQHRTLLRINVGVLTVSIVLTAAMASAWGADGAAAAMVLTEYGLAAAFFVALRRGGHGVSFGQRPLVSLIVAAGASIAAAAALATLVGGVAVTAVWAAVACVVFLGVALATGGVPAEITAVVRARLGR
ncbi:oligosaccharide flippase family protein [Patulibacter americanus]|uniref:oligosaccharide flippase family protein n=1 Tax=Patulibacter americanus TaxID=588672 RepID=UPI0003B57B9F|nr:oligosaccharide flippase family protein [Patulibacter americanus]